ncbi:hypothetical protein L1887_31852 [Cichorium endivia]|nr:hypothetical protein L1887_31852 [Cichorium endivia]
MTTVRSETWSWIKEALPVAAMLMVTCSDMGMLTIVKAAMNGGMNNLVYIVYHNTLGTLILFTFYIVHIFRNVERPPLTFRILFRFFILGLLGLCLFQVLVYIGLGYSSPTMASAIGNLAPGNTFLLAVVFRMEKIDMRSSISLAKLSGTIIAISGAMAVFSSVFRSSVVIWCLKKKGPVFVAMFNPLSIVIASTMGVTFLGDSLYLGSGIGAVIVAGGFYTVMWGQARQKKIEMDLDGPDEPGSSNHTTPLLSSDVNRNVS